ncbi:Uncharacterised protein [Mycobacteroides abscessus subsp. abscessus]|uniref:hypothetical protein n=1 Tax=Mycobacteroides abscessus TaxID=36809 RepID=UPI00092BC493|nr:hypothetical protein [Mycobacteroides abscessus]SIH25554.1 Uncharacterised protein [Mycobacteroides abscessus subsp. abscessus]
MNNNEEFEGYLESIGARSTSLGGGDFPAFEMRGNRERIGRHMPMWPSEELSTMPDGIVVIWIDDQDDRHAGALQTEGGRRVVRPSSVGRDGDDWALASLPRHVWVVPTDDQPMNRKPKNNNEEFEGYLESIGARSTSLGGGDFPAFEMRGNRERIGRHMPMWPSEELSTMPDGIVVIWIDDQDDRHAGALQTEGGRRVVRPSSVGRDGDDWALASLPRHVWVVPADD